MAVPLALLALAASAQGASASRAPARLVGIAAAGPALSLDPFATVNPTVAPSINPTPPAQVDEVLSADPGTWPGSGWTFTYQWEDCDPVRNACLGIPGATASTYTVDPADGGFELEVAVSADDHAGDTGGASSAPSAIVTAQPGAPVVQSDPTVGPVNGGAIVTATNGTWSPTPDSFATQWLSCSSDLTRCNAVGAPDSTTYQPSAFDAGNVLVYAVIATKNGLDSVIDFSNPTGLIAFASPTVQFQTPAPNAAYSPLTFPALTASFSCVAPSGMFVSTCTGTIAAGGALPIKIGTYSFTAIAVDHDGQTTSQTISYSIGGPPSISVTSPAAGATYTQNTFVPFRYGCTDFQGNLIRVCQGTQTPVSSLSGATVSSGGAADTATLGQHTVTITASDAFADSLTKTLTYTVVAASPPPPPPAPPALSVTSLAQAAARWHGVAKKGRPAGTAFTFTTNAAANVTFAFERHAKGRRVGRRCVAPTRANHGRRACVRNLVAGSLVVSEPAGAATVRFDGRISAASKRLPAGSYTATVTAKASDGSGSVVQVGTLSFTIVK